MTRLTYAIVVGLTLVWAPFGISSVHAQDAGPDAFASACSAALGEIQADRRVCAVGVVESDTHLRVLFSNRSEIIFRRVNVYESPVMQGREVPLAGLGKLVGQTVAIGGFDNGMTLYSARLLSP